MQDASNAEMRRQIKREGRRWGLVPLERDGRVVVCQVARAFVQTGDQPGFTADKVFYVADVTMDHGFAGALLNLRRLETRDANALADERNARIAEAHGKVWDDKMHEHDATAKKYIGAMGWDGFLEALTGPDPRNRAQRRAVRARDRQQMARG